MQSQGEQTSSFKLPEPSGYKAIAIAPALSAQIGPSAPAVVTESQAAGATTPPESLTCKPVGGALAQPLKVSRTSRPSIPVRMPLYDDRRRAVGLGDLRSSPVLAVQFGYRTQTVGPFTWCPCTKMWKATLSSAHLSEVGTHHVEAHPGDAGYDVEMCAQTVTRRAG